MLTDWLEHQNQRFDRKRALFRGWLLKKRGATAGCRFGLGRSVTVVYPNYFHAGSDIYLCEYSYFHCLSMKGVYFGNRTSIDRNCWLHCGGTPADYRHGFFVIGDDSYIGCNAVLGAGGGISIGNHVLIGQCVNFHSENHIYYDPTREISSQGVQRIGIIIKDDVWIGSKSVILDGVIVHQGAVIGAGTVVTKSVEPYAIVVGNPARVIGYRGEGKYAHRDLS